MAPAPEDGGGRADLLAATADLVAIPSVSHHEDAIADRGGEGTGAVLMAHGGAPGRQRRGAHRTRARATPRAGRAPRHRAAWRRTRRRGVEGDTLWGVGASDMKGGLAVMLDVATSVAAPAVDLTWCFYACEEVGREESGLLELWQQRPELLAGDAAVLGEPTDALVEAGCQGTMRVRITVRGVRAHTARPFTGRNAIHRLGPLIERVAALARARGGARRLHLRRAAPGGRGQRGSGSQRGARRGQLGHQPPLRARPGTGRSRGVPAPAPRPGARTRGRDTWERVDAGDGAPPSLGHPLLAALVERTGAAPRAKVGWTDVASFWEHGVPAANFGPGDPLLAHHPDERVTRRQLEQAREVLVALVS